MTDWTQDNPYNPNSQDKRPQTLPLDKIIEIAMDSAAAKLNVWLPAVVVRKSGDQKVAIQPLLQRRYADGTVKSLPVIENVIVQMPILMGIKMRFPITVGDQGMAVFCDRSLDAWSAGGGMVDPQDTRKHDLSDPVFIPGLTPFSGQTEKGDDKFYINVGDAELSLDPAGKFQFKNNTAELLSQLKLLTDTLSTASTIIGGPFTPDVVAILQQITQKLVSLGGT